MKIGGLQKISLIDYPGHLTAIVFTQGCNFHCPYCHNPELVQETAPLIPEKEIFAFLTRRAHLLDAVTITGGEPTIHKDLVSFIERVHTLGFKIKLDTNGTNPDVVATLIAKKLISYVAMDIKAPLTRYEETVARPVDITAISQTISLLKTCAIPYEFRTTVVKTLLSQADFESIGKTIEGAPLYYLQKFTPTKTLNPAFLRKTCYTDEELATIKANMERYVTRCEIR
jgi:pyruvate formate lyase activating enzyme